MKTSVLFTTLICLLSGHLSFAQNIKGNIVDAEGEHLAFANVVLYSAVDSSMVKVELTNDKGDFQFRNIPKRAYWITISYVGLPEYNSPVFELDGNYDFSTIQVQSANIELEEVTVTAKRPLIELKPDKTVFNVEGSVNAAGNNAMELLKKAPGVVVDNNENINLLGKSNVIIYIDGKPSPLNGEELAAYLKTLQSSDIDNIEIITNPSAKYDAEGTGGIINIRLKKDKSLGANASLSLSYAEGIKRNYNASINTNYRTKDFNLFGNFGYYNGANVNYLQLYREQNDLFFDATSDMWGGWEGFNGKAGIDYYINKKSTIGFMANGNISNDDWHSLSRTSIGMVSDNAVDSLLIAESHSDKSSHNLNFNLNYRFDSGKGKSLSLDADYGQYRMDANEAQPNVYKTTDETIVLNERNYRNSTPTDIDIYSFKADAELPMAEGTLGFGVKSALVKTDNTFDFYNVFADQDVLDINRSNSFTYLENVNAAYLNYSRQIKQLGIQVGFRTEQTNSEGDLQSMIDTEDDNVTRSYIDFFPSAGLTYQLNQKNTFQLTYSRRINRPDYYDLNPFEGRIDELTFEKGNPFLNPEYTNSIQLTHTFNYFLNTSIGYSHTTDLIAQITDTVGVNETTITSLNLADQKVYSLNLSGAVPIKKWWNTYTSMTGFITDNFATFDDGKTIDISAPTFNIYSQHTFTLPWDINLEVSGWFTSASVWEGNFEARPQGSLDAGLQKKLWDGRGSLRVSYGDILGTTDWNVRSTFGPLFIRGNGGWDSQKVRVSFNYMFGNNQVKTNRRKSGLEEESNRIKSGN